MNTWRVELRFGAVPTLTDGQAEALAEAVNHIHHDPVTGRLSVVVFVSPETVGDAHTRAWEVVTGALSSAQVTGELTGATVDSVEAAEREVYHPVRVMAVVTAADAGRILGVSRERARALLSPESPKRDPRAPHPIAESGAGYLWAREAVDAYAGARDPSWGAGKFV